MSLPLPILDAQPVRPVFAQGPRSLSAVKLLRLSVTDRCNLRCIYCMPEGGTEFFDRQDLLSVGDFVAVAAAARRVGVTHLKVTGGEPTVRADLPAIIAGLKALDPADLSMTTNGLLLERLARPLKAAGLDRLTVSWDSMQPARIARIARGAGRDGQATLDAIRAGLAAAADAGFTHVKINVVVIGGINDDEAADFARLTLDHSWTVRFIEYMPLGDATLAEHGERYTVGNAQIKARIEAELGPLIPIERASEPGVGPATVYQLQPGIPDSPFVKRNPDSQIRNQKPEIRNALGRIGFISAMSQPFCETCNRLRLTARGELRACLFEGGEADLLPALRPAPRPEMISELMRQCVALKPEVHSSRGNRAMSQLGG